MTKASSKDQWASIVLQSKVAKIKDLWHELYYYSYEKTYNLWDIKRIRKILSSRFKN